jgi:hypothetical protein
MAGKGDTWVKYSKKAYDACPLWKKKKDKPKAKGEKHEK